MDGHGEKEGAVVRADRDVIRADRAVITPRLPRYMSSTVASLKHASKNLERNPLRTGGSRSGARKRVRTTGGGSTRIVRNSCIREDTANNLDVDPAHFEKKLNFNVIKKKLNFASKDTIIEFDATESPITNELLLGQSEKDLNGFQCFLNPLYDMSSSSGGSDQPAGAICSAGAVSQFHDIYECAQKGDNDNLRTLLLSSGWTTDIRRGVSGKKSKVYLEPPSDNRKKPRVYSSMSLVRKRLLKEQHMQDEDAGRPYRKFI